MKKLAAVVLVLLAVGGCRTHCENVTVFTMGEKGCRAACVEKPTLQCDCNSKCPCHEQKQWKKDRDSAAKQDQQNQGAGK